ncbi:MAG TPA: hypothetical protein VMN60_01140, partial [Longimicrobiales bacterium]|nr:hypothetical protein [Longimicrobiales bacterium]
GGSVTFSQSGDAPALENTGTFDIGAGRTLHATAGSLTNVQGGIIRGTGTLRLDGSAISNAGTLSPGGAGIGKLRIQGALENTATAILESDIAGAAAVTEYDVLEVTGAVTLNGDLAIRRAAGYTPAINTNFDVVTALSRAGNFSNVLGTAIDGSFSFQVNYLAAGVRLTVID